MESIAEKSKKQNGLSGSESLSDSLSKGSSSSSTSSSRSSSDESKVGKDCCSSPAPLGWPILKVQMTKSSSKDAAQDVRNSTVSELDSKISGLFFKMPTFKFYGKKLLFERKKEEILLFYAFPFLGFYSDLNFFPRNKTIYVLLNGDNVLFHIQI